MGHSIRKRTATKLLCALAAEGEGRKRGDGEGEGEGEGEGMGEGRMGRDSVSEFRECAWTMGAAEIS